MGKGLIVCAALAIACGARASSAERPEGRTATATGKTAPASAGPMVTAPDEWWCFSLDETKEGICVREHAKCEKTRATSNDRLTAVGVRSDDLFRDCHAQSSAFCFDKSSDSEPTIVSNCYPALASCERYRLVMRDMLEEHIHSDCKLVK